MSHPITIPAATARLLANTPAGERAGGWTVVAHEDLVPSREATHHRIVIRNEKGEHYASTYDRGRGRELVGLWVRDVLTVWMPVSPRPRVVVDYVDDPADMTDVTEGPFDVMIADGQVQLLDDCPTCRTGSVVALPAGDALLGAAQLALAAALAGVPEEPEARCHLAVVGGA